MSAAQNGYVQLNFVGSNPTVNNTLLPFVGVIPNLPGGLGMASVNWGPFQLNLSAGQACEVLVQQPAFIRNGGGSVTTLLSTTGWIIARRMR